MPQTKQTPRVWSDAIPGSEILANWTKLGISAVFLWLSIGIVLGATVGALWFMQGTTSLERRLWVHHIRNGIGIGGRIADLPNPNGSGARIQVSKEQVQRYTRRSYETVSQRFTRDSFWGPFWQLSRRRRPPFFFVKAAGRPPRINMSAGLHWHQWTR
jgi:hypothetical protein